MNLFPFAEKAMNMYPHALYIFNAHISLYVTAFTFALSKRPIVARVMSCYCGDKARHSCCNDKSEDMRRQKKG